MAGRAGYSLLALVDADFPPVQLGWGFTLNGVGGLLAVNRSASTDALHAALKANTLSSILFPKNAITNAPQVLATIEAIFPTAAGRFLFGPMALIGWGTPALLTAAIAIVIELPEPIRIILIARLSARLPSESVTLIKINMDALGVLDLSQDSLSLDAQTVRFPADRLHPERRHGATRQLELLAARISAGDRRLPSAVHATRGLPGAAAHHHRHAVGRNQQTATGSLSGAFLQHSAIRGHARRFYRSVGIWAVRTLGLRRFAADRTLSLRRRHFRSGGADCRRRRPYVGGTGCDAFGSGAVARDGDFKISLLFFDVHKSFSVTWGSDAPAQPIAPVNVLPLLTAALADARNWGAALPSGTSALVSLNNPGVAVVHPLARLEVHESVVPLGLAITQLGAAPVAGATTFTISGYHVNGSTVAHEAVEDDFAPAQFFNLSDSDKLGRPSLRRMMPGCG